MGSPLYDDAVPQPYDTDPDDEFSCGDPDCSCHDDIADDGRPIVTIDTGGLL